MNRPRIRPEKTTAQVGRWYENRSGLRYCASSVLWVDAAHTEICREALRDRGTLPDKRLC
jgi:hypothetical protein